MPEKDTNFGAATGCVGLGTHGSQRDLSVLGVLGEEKKEGFSWDCVVVIGPLPQVRSQSTQTRAQATKKRKGKRSKTFHGERH